MARTPEQWNVEDNTFWESQGKQIAQRNLWVSIPNLLCGFSAVLGNDRQGDAEIALRQSRTI